ncbi:hypothetical protein FHS83_002177 [Rhizomicrobium palustre]|jgi:hypothetical protein|uniref:Uncharacterized protein n=1 Tax=Rhizomicrobium palustre TaxID=189966 RepID=A0A846N033_9PROT|nr:hypothetical protein [Rhizomicrobium palustre]NIK88859.1 hypothetical protein [Rhizomicrobium palustre]
MQAAFGALLLFPALRGLSVLIAVCARVPVRVRIRSFFEADSKFSHLRPLFGYELLVFEAMRGEQKKTPGRVLPRALPKAI